MKFQVYMFHSSPANWIKASNPAIIVTLKKEILYDYWINVSCCKCENKLGKQQNTDKSKPNTFMLGFLFKTLVLVGCSTLQTCNDELLNNLSSFHFRVKLYSSLRWKGIIKDLCQPLTLKNKEYFVLMKGNLFSTEACTQGADYPLHNEAPLYVRQT